MVYDRYRVPAGRSVSLKDYSTDDTRPFKEKADAQGELMASIEQLATYQDVLYAQDTYALLIIVQAMDAAGKDSVIKHVMSGVNPQGCEVFSFKAPSAEELDHDFLWRCMKNIPERGRIGIFNRSYYEEALVVRVHPEILQGQRIPAGAGGKRIWADRFEDINSVERYLTRNGIVILKFFLHVSKKKQKERFLERIDTPEKNWKFSYTDVQERAHWGEYMKAYEEVLRHTSTEWAPWYVIPADHKWFTRAAVAGIVVDRLKSLGLRYPVLSDNRRQELKKAKEELANEKEP
jgi:PPK2 family polyphosphate:nucleotide phosphotransferase